jgi:hypothetical protein
VRTLVHESNLLPAWPKGTFACPDDTGARIDLHMIYLDSPEQIVHVAISGCRHAWTRSIVRSAMGHEGQSFISRLEPLTSATR